MQLPGKKLGLLLSTAPSQPGFQHGLALAETALAAGVDVYLYCIDDAVAGLPDARLQALAARGLKLFGCAYALQTRDLAADPNSIPAGLGALSDVMTGTDRFVSFN